MKKSTPVKTNMLKMILKIVILIIGLTKNEIKNLDQLLIEIKVPTSYLEINKFKVLFRMTPARSSSRKTKKIKTKVSLGRVQKMKWLALDSS